MKEDIVLTIHKDQDGDALKVTLEGRLDTMTAPELEKELKGSLDDVRELTFVLTDLEYISSAGLRVLLMAQKTMSSKGSMKVTGVNDLVREIFEVTGFTEILTIE
ncbi:MAG: STAS domain-containing protein [Lachnospiraceae bacterium]|nr:STAS domain-containing protein [Lachnospiraceae bacterium]